MNRRRLICDNSHRLPNQKFHPDSERGKGLRCGRCNRWMLLGIKEIGWPEEGEGKAVSAEIASDTNPAQPHTHTTSPQSVLPKLSWLEASIQLVLFAITNLIIQVSYYQHSTFMSNFHFIPSFIILHCSFHFISIHFISLHFISFDFISFTSFHYISFHCL